MYENFLKISGQEIKNTLVYLPQLVFEVTDACNLRCKYCGYGELYEGFDPRGRSNLSLKKACNILDYLAKLWNECINSSISHPITLGFYGGEPLLNMRLIKNIIQYVESLNIKVKKFHFNMTTNGLLLNRYMDYLVEKEFRLLISLDGNEENHSYRVDHNFKNSHRQTIQNIKLLQQEYPEYFSRYVRFNTVLHNRNSAESAHNYIKNNFGKNTRISQLNNSGIRKDKINEFFSIFQNVESSIKNSANCETFESELFLEAPRTKRLTTFLQKFSGNMFDNYSSLFLDTDKIKTTPTGTCIPFFKKMFVTVNGKILQCEKVDHKFSLGQVTNEKVELDFDNIAESHNNYIFKFIKQCNTCVFCGKCPQCVLQVDGIENLDTKCASYSGNTSLKKSGNLNLKYLGKNPGLYKKIMLDVRIIS